MTDYLYYALHAVELLTSPRQPAWVSVVIGGTSKIIASTVTYPYQLVKSKMQQRDAINAETQLVERRYTSTWDCAVKVWR